MTSHLNHYSSYYIYFARIDYYCINPQDDSVLESKVLGHLYIFNMNKLLLSSKSCAVFLSNYLLARKRTKELIA